MPAQDAPLGMLVKVLVGGGEGPLPRPGPPLAAPPCGLSRGGAGGGPFPRAADARRQRGGSCRPGRSRDTHHPTATEGRDGQDGHHVWFAPAFWGCRLPSPPRGGICPPLRACVVAPNSKMWRRNGRKTAGEWCGSVGGWFLGNGRLTPIDRLFHELRRWGHSLSCSDTRRHRP